MLKIRVMPTLLYRDFGLVKGVGFDSWRQIGNPLQAFRVYSMRGVDEMVFLDVRATLENRDPDYALIAELCESCFMPLSVGGGIRNVEQVRLLLRAGADKVIVNTAAVETPELVEALATRFGSQCVTVSIDVVETPDGYRVVTHSGQRVRDLDPVAFARSMEARGAGEILLTSVSRDGAMSGYDVAITRAVSDAVSIPVIASGGAGSAADALAAIAEGGASAVAAASMYHFTETTPADVKKLLASHGLPVRL